MAGKKSGKKGRKKNESKDEEKSPQLGEMSGDTFKAYRNRPLSSESSENDSEFVGDDESLDSESQSKRKKQKKTISGDLVVPPKIDFAGLPEEPVQAAVTHRTRSHDAGSNNCKENKPIKTERIPMHMIYPKSK